MQKLFQFNFELDDFQREAIGHIETGQSVVVCAPTGAGKTVIAEYAINIALKANKRVFYTTPLKALSNQKFRDFQQTIGENNVGLLTGDISINRDAPVVVMTTEVFRNMLYGTTLGKLEDNLYKVMFVVLDECHYMNDAERGTVWEESIIYCPPNIQVLALSATIANAKELTDWIKSVHNNTALVNSNFRPVPLRNFYFINDQLIPLISPGAKVNQQIKKIKLSKGNFYKKKFQTPLSLVKILHTKDMLPAIYFCFSRKKCDTYLIQCSKAVLLSEFEKRKLKYIIDEYIAENPLIANHRHLEYIYSGVASHHAGLLPGWKVLIEKLFQQGLIKVVFATETLAAGINMPARTTIISEISKHSDDGHRTLTASEFLQMSGRAGRRGMDKIGYVVTLASPFHTVNEVANLALATSDPLNSQFTPTYSMVLNLLQRFNLEQAKKLILNSFGYFTSTYRLTPLLEAKNNIQADIDKIAHTDCPYNRTNDDLLKYQKNKEKYVELKRLYNTLKKQAKHSAKYKMTEIEEYYNKCNNTLSELEKFKCHRCVLYKKHIKSQDALQHMYRRLTGINKTIEFEQDVYWNNFLNIVKVLTDFGYLKGNYPTELGITASYFRCENELYIVEVINSGLLDDLTPAELAAVVCAIISEEPRNGTFIKMYPSKSARIAINEINNIVRRVHKVQRKYSVNINLLLNMQMSGTVETWASEAEWDTIVQQTSMDEGDIVRSIKRTIDILRQIAHAPYINPELASKCNKAVNAINREPVIELI